MNKQQNQSPLPLILLLIFLYYAFSGNSSFFPNNPATKPVKGFIVYELSERPPWLNILETELRSDPITATTVKSIDSSSTIPVFKKIIDFATTNNTVLPALVLTNKENEPVSSQECPKNLKEISELFDGENKKS